MGHGQSPCPSTCATVRTDAVDRNRALFHILPQQSRGRLDRQPTALSSRRSDATVPVPSICPTRCARLNARPRASRAPGPTLARPRAAPKSERAGFSAITSAVKRPPIQLRSRQAYAVYRYTVAAPCPPRARHRPQSSAAPRAVRTRARLTSLYKSCEHGRYPSTTKSSPNRLGGRPVRTPRIAIRASPCPPAGVLAVLPPRKRLGAIYACTLRTMPASSAKRRTPASCRLQQGILVHAARAELPHQLAQIDPSIPLPRRAGLRARTF